MERGGARWAGRDRPAEAPPAGGRFTCCSAGRARGRGGAARGGCRGRPGVAAAGCSAQPGAASRGRVTADLSLCTWRRPARGSGAPGKSEASGPRGSGNGGVGGAMTPGGERVAGVTTWPDLRPERDRCVAAGTARPERLPLPPRRPPQPGGISCPSCREQFEEPASSPDLEGETLPGALRGSIARMRGASGPRLARRWERGDLWGPLVTMNQCPITLGRKCWGRA